MTSSKVRRGATDSTARRPAKPKRRENGVGRTLQPIVFLDQSLMGLRMVGTRRFELLTSTVSR